MTTPVPAKLWLLSEQVTHPGRHCLPAAGGRSRAIRPPRAAAGDGDGGCASKPNEQVIILAVTERELFVDKAD
jgi:hypothetical protein